jgi:hypothetical protein
LTTTPTPDGEHTACSAEICNCSCDCDCDVAKSDCSCDARGNCASGRCYCPFCGCGSRAIALDEGNAPAPTPTTDSDFRLLYDEMYVDTFCTPSNEAAAPWLAIHRGELARSARLFAQHLLDYKAGDFGSRDSVLDHMDYLLQSYKVSRDEIPDGVDRTHVRASFLETTLTWYFASQFFEYTKEFKVDAWIRGRFADELRALVS